MIQLCIIIVTFYVYSYSVAVIMVNELLHQGRQEGDYLSIISDQHFFSNSRLHPHI